MPLPPPPGRAARPRLSALIASMTLAEKLGQLTMTSANMAETGPIAPPDLLAEVRKGEVGSALNLWGPEAVAEMQTVAVQETRLGIPMFVGLDVVHGFRTLFPVPLAETGAFDPALWQETARAAAREAAAEGVDLTFAPMLDLCRDPRWGRIVEGPGEDPVTGALFARAKVAGFQGDDLAAADAVAATAKHFGAYGASAGGLDYGTADVSARTLDEVYHPPFAAAVAGGVAAIMPAFTDLAGEPVTGHRPMLRGLLRQRWGFRGVVVSDYHAIAELMTHGVAADAAEAAARALRAGVDIDMMSWTYRDGLPVALARGLVSMAEIDAAVRRVLALKVALGLFDDPWRRCRHPGLDAATIAGHRSLARRAAARACVLLHDRQGLLPIADGTRRIAVIGPLAASADDMLGPWPGAGRPEEAVSPLKGLSAALAGRTVVHVPGVEIEGSEIGGITAAVAAAAAADLVILCLGERRWMSGEAACRGRLGLPGQQAALAEAVIATGRPVLMVLFSGRPLTLGTLMEGPGAALAAWFPGSEGGHALADILTGRAEAGGRLPVSWPWELGQVPVYFARRIGGRPGSPDDGYSSKYLDVPTAPQFPFGHGGVAGVAWRDPVVESGILGVTLHNATARATDAVTFVFLRLPVAPVARPALELAGFVRTPLGAGETARLAIPLDPARLDGLLAAGGVAPGRATVIEVLAGPSADRARLVATSMHRALAAPRG